MSLNKSKIGVTVQDAFSLVAIIEAGTFPASAFADGKGRSFETFKAGVVACIEGGKNGSPVIERSLVAKWLAATAPEVHSAFLREFNEE